MSSETTKADYAKVAKTAPPKKHGRWTLLIILATALIALFTIVKFLPVKDYFISLLEWVKELGMWGPVVVAAVYIPACVLLFPGSVLTMGAGFLFGVITGTIAVSIGSTLGACAAFLLGRTLARAHIEEKVKGNRTFTAIDEAVGKEGFKIVFLTRLSPVFPFTLLNYAYGLTKVPFRHYALASWIGMLPGTLMFVYLGSAVRSLADIAAGKVQGGAAQRILFWVGLIVTFVVATLVTRIARNAIKQAVPQENKGS